MDSKLRKARPPLHLIAPLTSTICWGYGIFNTVIGLVMLTVLRKQGIPVIVPYWAWGCIFVALGVATIYGLITNNWGMTRGAQLFGVTVKTIWAIKLLIISFIDPQTISILIVWLFIVYVQIVTYIYFLPPWNENDTRS